MDARCNKNVTTDRNTNKDYAIYANFGVYTQSVTYTDVHINVSTHSNEHAYCHFDAIRYARSLRACNLAGIAPIVRECWHAHGAGRIVGHCTHREGIASLHAQGPEPLSGLPW